MAYESLPAHVVGRKGQGHCGGVPRAWGVRGDVSSVANQFGGLKAEDAKRLNDPERENATLKRLLADAQSEKDALREIAKGNF